ncbi:condensin-1 complex subunit CAP-D2 [Beta vulgaris subsp. vulgaris]|uniref:condensin-1 complex subunit CAP-D2 n=1 Tax=Beta vulgaris subsp. vulgaris TaxID=3555 RepID=UPI0020368B07|nr:condensin-1 complex subunit CAP-D2 [Beta vulgaris subsp. vulgaris]
MAPTFIFPPNLHSLEQENDDNHLFAQNPTNITSFTSSDLEEFVKGLSFDLSDKELFCIENQDVFDRVYSLVKCFSSLTPPCKLNFVESLRSNFSVLLPNIDSLSRLSHSPQNDDDGGGGGGEDGSVSVLERVASHRNAFKIYTFFLVHIILAEESSNTSTNTSKTAASSRKKLPINSWKWEGQRGRILTLIANSLEVNLSLLFGSSDTDENYLSFITKNAFLMFENPILLKDSDVKDALCRIIGSCATKYHYLAQTSASIIHLLHKYDFVVIAMADAVAGAEKKYADGSLATSIIREIGRTNPKDYVKDTAGADNIGRFLVELSERLPKLISTNIGILVPHFGGESYKIRNALVGLLGKLVSKAFKDEECEVSSKSVRLRTKQAMLEILLERCRDVSAYTRSRVLQVWSELCEEHSVPIGLWNEVAALAAGRLEDKSAIVRKSALNLLIVMLQHNPFGPQLRISSFEATLDKYRKKLSALQPEVHTGNEVDGASSDIDNCNGDGDVDHVNSEARSDEQPNSLTDSYLSQVEEDTVLKDNSVPDVGNLEQTRALVASLEAGLSFSKCISATMPTLVQLMASSSATDVENTILLLMRCRQFQIEESDACLRKMLPLVFSQDKSIYEAVENAFVTIYITKNPLESAKNLLNLAVDSNIGDLAALESIIGALVLKGDISPGTISALWDFFCFNLPRTTAEQCRGALIVICMAAKSSSEILGSHLQDIIDIGFGRWAKVDPLLARTACTALQRLSEDDRKKLLANSGSRMFATLESLITGSWLPENIWYNAADKAIGAIYTLHPAPEIIAARVVKKSHTFVFNLGESGPLSNDMENGTAHGSTTVEAGKLSRYLFVISHVAMHQLVYIESCVRKIQKEKAKKERQSADGSGSTLEATKDSGINAELGVAASEDAILDSLADKAEREILSGGSDEKNLLGFCAPFLSKLCRNFNLMQKNPELQAAAMLALCRFMVVDAAFCEANLQLLFTVVESASSETVRSNCTIALGDLAIRFPNLVEPWTEHMYARLRDPSVSVRKNAVLVLSHLILNEMMKVKGYIYEMAMRLEDEDDRIANLAKLFFTELAKKGSNPIYNLLPDILGKLSKQNLEKESFCNIMQFLIGSIKKDKQMEGLVEKLCNRFNGVTDSSHWQCLAYCLSQLAFTDKGMKKLIESFKTYEHALCEDSVMDHFRNIINKGKKFAKPELKSSIEEFEEKLNKFHLEKKEQEVTARNAQAHKNRIESLESVMVGGKTKLENEETFITEDVADGEVMDPSATTCSNDIANTNANADEEDHSTITSEGTHTEAGGEEVLSPIVNQRDMTTSKSRKSKQKTQKVVSSATVRTRSTRSKQR